MPNRMVRCDTYVTKSSFHPARHGDQQHHGNGINDDGDGAGSALGVGEQVDEPLFGAHRTSLLIIDDEGCMGRCL